jgi:hypothetical protein
MENQSDDSPRLVALKLDDAELGEGLTQNDKAASEAGGVGHRGNVEDQHRSLEIVESSDLLDELVDVGPSDVGPGALFRHARHPSTGQPSHPARIEEDI